MLDKIDAYQHEKELEVQEKLKASERKLEKAKKAGNAEDEEKHAATDAAEESPEIVDAFFRDAPTFSEELRGVYKTRRRARDASVSGNNW